MSDDLIKRDDALAAVNGWHQITHIRAALEAVPIVTTHRHAGESEASVYDRKGFPPIGLQGHAHAPVADSHPAIDTAAIREAALQDRIEGLERERERVIKATNDMFCVMSDSLNTAHAKLAKAVEYLRKIATYTHIGTHEQGIVQNAEARIACTALADLEGGE